MTTETNTTNTYLSFIIDNEYFAVNVSKVLEVLQKQNITRVPNVTDEIKGVTNFRGEIIPVFETRIRFGLPDRSSENSYVIVVLEITKNNVKSVIGALADKVKNVISIDESEIMAVPKMNNKHKEALISGIYKQKEDYIMLLDVDKMFSDDEINTLNEIAL